MTTPLYDHYMQSIKDAMKNLEGEELEKCLTALNNYMKNFGEQEGQKHGRSKE